MAEPKVRFKKDDGSSYPAWTIVPFSKLSVPSGIKNKNDADLDSYSISNDRGFIPQNEQFEDAGYLNNADRSLYYIVRPGSFAYNPARINIGSIGYQNVGKDVLVSSLYEIFNTTDDLDDGFLMSWFKTVHFQKHVRRLSEGGVRQYFYYDKLCMVKFSLPCLEEQQKIADFLSSVDDVISTSEQEVENLETQKKAVMKKIFSQEVRFKKDDGSDFPEWCNYALRDVLTERNETSIITDDYPLLSFTIEEGVIDPKDKKTNKRDYLMKDKDTKKFKKTELDDIIYNPSNMRFGAIHRNKLCKGLVSPIYAIFSSKVNPIFMEYVVSDSDFIKRSQKLLEGTVVKLRTLKPEAFLNMEVCIPSDSEEQRLIADFLSDFDEAIAAAKKELELWKELKKGLLQQMFV